MDLSEYYSSINAWNNIIVKMSTTNACTLHQAIRTHTAPKYLDNIVKIFLGNILRLPKYFETYH